MKKLFRFEIDIKCPKTAYGLYQTYLQIYLFDKLVYSKLKNVFTQEYFKPIQLLWKK